MWSHLARNLEVVFLSLVLSPAVLAQGKPGVDFTPKLVPIVEGVYAYEGPLALPGEEEIVRTNSLVVVTGEGVVVVDGQDSLEEAERMIAAIEDVTDEPIRYLVNASPHGDHVNGNAAFAGAKIVAHERAREAMIEAADRAGAEPPLLPELVYSDRMTLHVGSKTLELRYYGPAHTPGDTVVYIPEDRVAFLSEIYFNGVFTSLGDGFAVEHLEALEAIEKLDADWFLPGHGYIDGQSKAELRAGLERYHENVRAVHDAVLAHVEAGDSLETTLSEIDAELGELTELPFYDFLKGRSVEATYRALSEERKQ